MPRFEEMIDNCVQYQRRGYKSRAITTVSGGHQIHWDGSRLEDRLICIR